MAETNDTGIGGNTAGASNAGATPAPVPANEPRILEEHIVAPPPKAVPSAIPTAPVPISAPEPTPPQNVPLPPPLPLVPPTPTLPTPLAKNERIDLSRPAASSAPTDAPTPRVPAPIQSAPAIDAQVNADITHILEGVKLPERTSAAAPEKPVQRTYDTSLTGGAPSEEEKAGREARVREAARAVNDSLPTGTPKSSDDVRSVHTLKEDLQTVVRTKKISMVRAVALEEEKRHRPNVLAEEQAARAHRRSPVPIIMLTLFLFLLGAGALGGVYILLRDRTAPVVMPSAQLLFAEQTVPFPISGLAPGDVQREIANARVAGASTLGSIVQIIPMLGSEEAGEIPATFNEFITAIGAQPPEELARSVGTEFFFGFHAVDENAPVMVTTIASYERAFAAMLEWERDLNGDLAPIFTPVSMQTVGPDGILVERKFEDSVIRNYDVRVLKDNSGQIQLFYSFPTRNILIIAESPYSFTELLARLRADRRL